MKLGELGIWVTACSIAWSFAACSDTHPRPGDRNTNWLRPCTASSECGGGLDCIGDVCTRACDARGDCSAPGLSLQCAAGVCAESAAMPMAGSGASGSGASGSSAPASDASIALPDAATPVADGGKPMPVKPVACELEEQASRKPGPNRYDTMAPGPGACNGTTLGGVIAAIHAAHPDLADITYIFNPDAPPPPIAISNSIAAFELENGFAIAMRRGMGDCESGCIENEYWYFRTDDACAPAQIGHYRPQHYEPACMLQGYPMWDEPVPPAEYPAACGDPIRSSSFTGEHRATGCGSRMACTGPGSDKTPEAVTLELRVEIDKDEADPTAGAVTLRGTGHELLDGRPLPATFEGAVVRVSATESLPSTCLEQFTIEMLLDFDGNLASHLHYEETRTPDCTNGGDYCKGSLQLDFGRMTPYAACYPQQDVSTAFSWARAPLLDCDTDDDCTTVPAPECSGGCPTAVRADKAAELAAAIERIEAAYCTNPDCRAFVDCRPASVVCREGKCGDSKP